MAGITVLETLEADVPTPATDKDTIFVDPTNGLGVKDDTGTVVYPGAGAVTNTGTLTDHALIVGNGGADVSALASLGTTTTVLHGNAAGDPTFAAVSLTADVSGDLPFANLVQASGASKIVGRGSASGAGDFQELTLGSGVTMTGTVLSATGTGGDVTHTGTLTSGRLITGNGTADITVGNLSGDVTTSGGTATTIANSAVTLAKIANAAANSKLLGSGASGSGSPYAEVTLGSGLTMTGTTLSAATSGGTVTHTGALTSGQIVTGNGTDDIVVVTATAATAILNSMVGDSGAGGTKGLAPAPSAGDAAAGKFLKADGTYAVPPGTGSSGNVTSSTAFGSEPGSPASGDLDLYSNAQQIARYSGSAWIPWGPIWKLSPPVSGSFSWVNQGSATVSTTTGGIVLYAPPVAAADVRLRVKSAPATPYTVTVGFLSNMVATGVLQSMGLCFRDSGTGKFTVWGLSFRSEWRVLVDNFTNATSYSGQVALQSVWSKDFCWLQMSDNGTDRIYRLSWDGVNFMEIYRHGRTTFITPDQIGFYASTDSSTFPIYMTLLSYLET